MTSNDDSRDGKTPSGSNISGKRPHATLELEAVEIRDRSGQRSKAVKTPVSGTEASPATATAPEKAAAIEQQSTAESESAMQDTSQSKGSHGMAQEPTDADNSAEPGSADTSITPPTVRRRGGVFGPLMAGILGGIIALLGGEWAWQQLGLPKLASSTTRSVDAIELRLADLEQNASTAIGSADAASAQSQSLDVIAGQLEDLKTLSKTTAQLVEQQAQLRQQVTTLTNQPIASAASDELSTRISDLEQRIAVVMAAAEANPNAGSIPQ
ncbi:MAG: hypothetical protein K0U34_03900, partial [Alphaproteobacteria bacterium]|nr:hypothetical protein [Alphaproteobacteria bacterium]